MASATIRRLADETVSNVVGMREIPEAIRSAATMDRPDYADLCTATTSRARQKTAEEWARCAMEETAAGRSAPRVWRLLGLRLGATSSPDFVQGWSVADRDENWIRVEASSWCMTAHAVVHVDDTHVSIALFVRYDGPVAAFIWPMVSAIHRRAVPVMLQQALMISRSNDIARAR
jgi:hypothetical protein